MTLTQHSVAALSLFTIVSGASGATPIDFGRDIRPLLSDNCFACHGPDENHRKAKLRLDLEEGAIRDLGGYKAVDASDPEKSELLIRVTSTDPDEVMPPPDSGKKLKPEQVEKLRRWIQEGAVWQNHWAYEPVRRVGHPEMEWLANPIDYFVLRRLKEEDLAPSPRAPKETLIRRVALSLTGLPPTPSEVDAFLADTKPGAYERLVDRLLESGRYGEHMARYWLDAARYGDTHGLHLDNERSIWPYRDWVVRAFNDNMPFDAFTIEQLAGDLLSDPTRDQLVATGFNRCNVTTSEGGAIPEEFAVRYAVDRVETMSAVWLGMTTGCAVCHDHKFDPITQKDFYRLYDFFNDFDENPMDGNAMLPPPSLKLASTQQELKLEEFDRQVQLVERVIRDAVDSWDYKDPLADGDSDQPEARDFVWVDDGVPSGVKASEGDSAWRFTDRREGPVLSGATASFGVAAETGQHFFDQAEEGLRVGKGDTLFAYVYLDPQQPPKEIMLQYHNGKKWEHRAYWGENLIDFGKEDTGERRHAGDLPAAGQWVRLEVEAGRLGFQPGDVIKGIAFTQHGGRVWWDHAGIHSRLPQAGEEFMSLRAWVAFLREQNKPDLPDALRDALKADPAALTDEQRKALRDYFVEHVYGGSRPVLDPLQEQVASLKKKRQDFDAAIPRTLITRQAKEPRPAHVLIRGEYDKPGDLVLADVPKVLPPFPADQPTNRLGLARWLVQPDHPLTSRVTVNRFWQQHFGIGLVRTAEDFGSQGEPPTHPALLDWLAAEFVASGWEVKHIQRLIVTSAAFQQDSSVSPGLLARDPENRLLARGPRYRMDAETIRDTLLWTSGLLVEHAGGRGVHPYQPNGIWEAVAYPSSNTAKYRADDGDALYRRSLYTFWKRTAPPPVMRTFDAPTRESCLVRRERTNTPLQALALLNDVQSVEAARHLARRMVREGGNSSQSRISRGFRLVTARHPDDTEKAILTDLYQAHLEDFNQDPDRVKQLLSIGDSQFMEDTVTPEMAAYTMVANTLLNLSETITLN